ncbi:MAG: hypothetical protein ACE10C_13445 [Candidatus Binatia bacterium]
MGKDIESGRSHDGGDLLSSSDGDLLRRTRITREIVLNGAFSVSKADVLVTSDLADHLGLLKDLGGFVQKRLCTVEGIGIDTFDFDGGMIAPELSQQAQSEFPFGRIGLIPRGLGGTLLRRNALFFQLFFLFIPGAQCGIGQIESKSYREGDLGGDQDEEDNTLPLDEPPTGFVFELMHIGNLPGRLRTLLVCVIHSETPLGNSITV